MVMPHPELKRPDDVLDSGFDYSNWLGDDTIDTSTWTVPSGITEDSESETTTTTTIWLSGGTFGQIYTLTNQIVTVGGRTYERQLTIICGHKYTTLTSLKQQIQLTGTGDDDALYRLMLAAEVAINNYCGRPDGFLAGATATTRYYAGRADSILRIDECVEVTAVAVKDSATDTTFTAWDTPTTNWAGDGDWFAYRGARKRPNFNPIAQGFPYTGLMTDPGGDYATFTSGRYGGRGGFRPLSPQARSVFTVQVTAKWGYASTVPAPVSQATLMQTARWYKRFETQMGDTLVNAELGQITYAQSLDPDVKFLLKAGRLTRPVQARI